MCGNPALDVVGGPASRNRPVPLPRPTTGSSTDRLMEPLAPARPPAWLTRVSLLLVFAIGGARLASAQPLPALTGVPPVYLKQGESQDLTLTGQNLAGVT